MKKIIGLFISFSAAVNFSITSLAEAPEAEFSDGECTVTEYGNAVLIDDCELLTDSEESYILDNIITAVEEKDISIGVVSSNIIKQELADLYYTIVARDDPDFALMLFNEEEYSYYFYGSAAEEFANDTDAFWMTDGYLSSKTYFVAGLQFPLDIQYHTVYEETPAETEAEAATDDYFTEMADSGIHTVVLENGYTAMLHDLDDSLTTDEEAVVLTDLMNAVREKGFNICILITDDVGADKSDYGIMDFTDCYYDEYCGNYSDGILLLINNDNKYDWFSTSGNCIKDDDILDALYDYLVDGNYNLACQRFVQEVKYYSEQEYVYYDDYDYYFDDEESEGIFSLVIFSFFVAIISVAIFTGSLNSGYRMKKNVSAADYKLKNSLAFSQNTDTYLRTYTTTRTVSSSSSSGRRSGSRSSGRSHRSSSGGRHGGGGRRR